jgi:hypothetical protein
MSYGRNVWRRSRNAALPVLLAGLALVLSGSQSIRAERMIDILAYFQQAIEAGRTGIARKTKPVDVRPAMLGEVVVTLIAGEGEETQSPPAKEGDMVVRNRCAETGNEQILVKSAVFAKRYEGPIGPADAAGWTPYRPRGVDMRYSVVRAADGSFSFTAPWGEAMIARPGDVIVQDPHNPTDTYRIAKAAFACTYEIVAAAASGK